MAEYNEQQIEQLTGPHLTSGNSEFGKLNKATAARDGLHHDGRTCRDIVQKLVREGGQGQRVPVAVTLKHKYRIPPPSASFISRDPSALRLGQRAEIAICDAITPYDYEYRNGPRLVITPPRTVSL